MDNAPPVLLHGETISYFRTARADLADFPMKGQSVYMDLLMASATTDLREGRAETIRELVREVTDWPRLLRLASFHGVLPLVAKTLALVGFNGSQVVLPPQLGQVGRDVAVRNLSLSGEQARILNALDSYGIPGIAFKGPVLAQMAYRSLGLRSCGDIDVLIPANKYRETEAVLLREGFQLVGRAGELEGVSRFLYRTLSRQSTFARGLVALDLHVGIMPPGYRYDPRFEDLMDRAVTVVVGGMNLRTFSPEDMLLILCFHGVKNRWEVLKHYCDVAELIRSSPGLDWDVVIDRARRTRATRILRLGIYMAHKLLDAPLPPGIVRWSMRDAKVEELERQLMTWLVRTHEERMTPDERFRFHLAVQDSVLTKTRYFMYALARRAQRSIAWVPED